MAFQVHTQGLRKLWGVSFFSTLAVIASVAQAEPVEVKGSVTVPYSKGFFSSGPDDKSYQAALNEAKLAAWNLYTAGFNDAKMKLYMKNKESILKQLDQYVQNLKIIDKSTDKDSKTINLVIRAMINESAVDAALGSTSEAVKQGTGKGSQFVFMFLSRQASSTKVYDDKRINVKLEEASTGSADKSIDTDNASASTSKTQSSSKTTTGGSVERKKAKTVYEVASSQDIDAAMGGVLSTGGFEVISYDDVVANCGGADRKVIATEFSSSDDMSTETRKSAINASRDCEVSLFATGTMDIGVQDTDPVSGNRRVFVSVRGQVWNIENKLPRKVASVGPIQFSGLGPDEEVAKRNALTQAAKEAGKAIVDQLNVKSIR